MFVLNRQSEHVSKLITYLQDANPKNRLVTYYAIAEYVVPHIIKDMDPARLMAGCPDVAIAVKDIVYNLNELAIIDKTLLERIFNNVLNYKLHSISAYKTVNTDLLNSICFQDILGITKYYVAEDIHTINTNFNLFKQVVAVVVNIIRDNKNILIKEEVK